MSINPFRQNVAVRPYILSPTAFTPIALETGPLISSGKFLEARFDARDTSDLSDTSQFASERFIKSDANILHDFCDLHKIFVKYFIPPFKSPRHPALGAIFCP